MTEVADKKEKYTYTVHLIGATPVTIEASNYTISQADNRVFFEDVDEKKYGQWAVFLSGVAAIHKKTPEKPGRIDLPLIPNPLPRILG
jgi:hypothetical protein